MCCIGKILCIVLATTSLLLGCIALPNDEAIELNITPVLEFSTVVYTYRSVLYFEDVQEILGFIPISQQRLLFSIKTNITAGIPLSEGMEVIKEGTLIRIRLPEPTILSVDADEESLLQYTVSETGRRINWVDVSEYINENSEVLSENAQEANILQKAKANTLLQVGELMDLLSVARYRVEFFTNDE